MPVVSGPIISAHPFLAGALRISRGKNNWQIILPSTLSHATAWDDSSIVNGWGPEHGRNGLDGLDGLLTGSTACLLRSPSGLETQPAQLALPVASPQHADSKLRKVEQAQQTLQNSKILASPIPGRQVGVPWAHFLTGFWCLAISGNCDILGLFGALKV